MSEIWNVAQSGPVEVVVVALQLLCFIVFGFLLSKEDISSHRLPNRLVGYWFLASVVLILCLGASHFGLPGILQGFLGMLFLGGGYLLMSLISAGAMGMGDVKRLESRNLFPIRTLPGHAANVRRGDALGNWGSDRA